MTAGHAGIQVPSLISVPFTLQGTVLDCGQIQLPTSLHSHSQIRPNENSTFSPASKQELHISFLGETEKFPMVLKLHPFDPFLPVRNTDRVPFLSCASLKHFTDVQLLNAYWFEDKNGSRKLE